jgi:hypothetical protein
LEKRGKFVHAVLGKLRQTSRADGIGKRIHGRAAPGRGPPLAGNSRETD